MGALAGEPGFSGTPSPIPPDSLRKFGQELVSKCMTLAGSKIQQVQATATKREEKLKETITKHESEIDKLQTTVCGLREYCDRLNNGGPKSPPTPSGGGGPGSSAARGDPTKRAPRSHSHNPKYFKIWLTALTKS